jgi:uncharacterized membrane protein
MTKPRVLSDKQRAWLAGELAAWRTQGLVSDDQGTRILDFYETAAETAERKRSRAVFALMAIAGVLVGLAALLLVAYNWEAMPRPVKLGLVLGAVLGTHGLAFYLRDRRRETRASEVAFFVGCLLYGAGIWLVAQIFHLSAHYPDGLWFWAVGVVPFALALEGWLLHALLALLLAVWAGAEVLGFGHLGAWLFGRWAWLPNGAYSLPLLAAVGLRQAYRRPSTALVSLYVALVSWWAVLQPFAWRWELSPAYFVCGVGGALLLIARAHPPESRLAIPYRLYGVLLLGGGLAPLSFYRFNIGPARASATGVAWGALVPTLAANAGMVGLAIWLMRVGLREDRGRPFAAGVFYFLLWALLRYFDLFGNFGGSLGASVMFLLCGAALFGLALYWRRRKEADHA